MPASGHSAPSVQLPPPAPPEPAAPPEPPAPPEPAVPPGPVPMPWPAVQAAARKRAAAIEAPMIVPKRDVVWRALPGAAALVVMKNCLIVIIRRAFLEGFVFRGLGAVAVTDASGL